MNYVNPAQWDYLWGSGNPRKLYVALHHLSVEKDTQAHVILEARLCQCLLGMRQDDAALSHANKMLSRFQGRPGLDVSLLRAVRLMCLMTNADTECTIREAPLIQGTDPSRMEAAVFSHYTVSTAYSVQGDPDTAMLHLARAEAIAQLLGMTHRLRVMRLELARQRLQAEHTIDPLAIYEEADTTHQATFRWGQTIGAVALTAHCEFQRALERSKPLGIEELPVLYALAGQPDPDEPRSESWADLAAQAIRAAEAGRYGEMPVLQLHGGRPLTKYSPILNGLRAAHGHGGLVEVELGPCPRRRDLRVLWHMVRLTAILNGRLSEPAAPVIAQVLADLKALPVGGELMALIQRLMPHQAILLTFSPGAAEVPALSGITVPLLMGAHVQAPARVNIHRPTGEMLIARGLGERENSLNTGFVSKARAKLRSSGIDLDHLLSAGQLYRWLCVCAEETSGGPHGAAWQAAVRRLLDESQSLRRVLRSIGETDWVGRPMIEG